MNQQSQNLSFKNATGVISYNMTNDYMFRAVLQKNQKVLTALICSLLHFDEKELTSVEITNPIELGKNCEAKEFWRYCSGTMSFSLGYTKRHTHFDFANDGERFIDKEK